MKKLNFEEWLFNKLKEVEDFYTAYQAFKGLFTVGFHLAAHTMEMDKKELKSLFENILQEALERDDIHFGPSPGDG